MRMLCMFDLPVETGEEQRAYRQFRKNIMKEGFIMMQYSVYVRTCPSKEFAERIEKRIKRIVPAKGNVRLISITEKQYQDMQIMKKKQGNHTVRRRRNWKKILSINKICR